MTVLRAFIIRDVKRKSCLEMAVMNKVVQSDHSRML